MKIRKFLTPSGPITYPWDAVWVKEAKDKENLENKEYLEYISQPYFKNKTHKPLNKELWKNLRTKELEGSGVITQGRNINPAISAINNYFGELKYDLALGNIPKGKYVIPAASMATLAVANIPATIGSVALGTVGGKAVDVGSLLISGNTWTQNMHNWTGIDKTAAEMTNPGGLVGGFKGFNLGNKSGKVARVFSNSKKSGNSSSEAAIDALASTNIGKRASEVAMRSRYDTHATSNPVPDILLGWMTAPWNRRLAVTDYILTGGKYSLTKNKPFGYKESLAPFKLSGTKANAFEINGEIDENLINDFKLASWKDKIKMLSETHKLSPNGTLRYNWGKYSGEPEVAYTGGFWSTHLPRRSGYGDAVDSYLYGTEIDPLYGMNRISIGNPKDYGIHNDYISKVYPEKSGRILVYETTPSKNDTMVKNNVESKGIYSSGSGDLLTSSSRYDAGGHVREFGYLLDENGKPIFSTMYLLFRNNKPWMKTSRLPEGIHELNVVTYNENTAPLEAYRSQDLWQYNPEKYLQRWGTRDGVDLLGHLGELGIRLVEKSGNPMIVRTPWRTSPTQIFTQ